MILSCFRGEKWIRRIWRYNKMIRSIVEGDSAKEVIYILTQFYSKKVYVGETIDLRNRIGKHLYEGRVQKTRKIYNIMRGIGLERWFVIPVQVATGGKNVRAALERRWMHDFRNIIINEKWTWNEKKKREKI